MKLCRLRLQRLYGLSTEAVFLHRYITLNRDWKLVTCALFFQYKIERATIDILH